MHPDEVAFLDAIRAGDDTARLVFADWLDDRGDPRGPWVRDPELWPFMAPDATDPVPRLLERVDGDVPCERWELLGRLGAHAVPALAAALNDGHGPGRRYAAEALEQIGPGAQEAVPALAAYALRGYDDEVRDAAQDALAAIGLAAVPFLAAALDDQNLRVRCAAAVALGQIGPCAHAAVPTLAATLRDWDAVVRKWAAWALGKIGSGAAEAVPALAATLRDEVGPTRATAAEALGQIGPGAHAAVPALAAALRDRDRWVRKWAAWALGKIGSGAAEAVPALIALQDDLCAEVREAGREAIEWIRVTV